MHSTCSSCSAHERARCLVSRTHLFPLGAVWQVDMRITERCEENGLPDPPSDPCGWYWMPEGEIFSLQWANAKEVTKIEDFGLYTDPGNKTGFTGSIIRAVFTVELEYHRFPFDKQLLNMTLQAPTSLPRSSVYFITNAQLNPNLQKHNLWDVANVTSESRSKPFVESRDYSSSSDPRYSVAQATFTIHLKRQVTYYLYNYIILEIVLCVLGLTSLFIPAESIDGRLGIALGRALCGRHRASGRGR